MNSRERIEQLNRLKIALQAVLELRKKLEGQNTQDEQVGIVQKKTSKCYSFRRSTLIKSLSLDGRRQRAQQAQQARQQKEEKNDRKLVYTR